MDANRTTPQYELTDELAKQSLPALRRDSSRKLAWVNSVCVLFLLVGILGANQPRISLKRPPPLVLQEVPIAIEPPPPPKEQQPEKIEPTQEAKPEARQVVAVTLDSPAVNFSVPTIGNLVVPNGVAVAPPANPMQPLAPVVQGPVKIGNTQNGGDRPAPPYPELALAEHQEGSTTLLFGVDETGAVTSLQITKTSGHSLLDRAAFETVKRKWIMPRNGTNQMYETTIDFHIGNPERN
jgi:protein TonB